MSDSLTVQPVFEVTAEVRRASSACCGSKLNVSGNVTQYYVCRGCGQPCERVLSGPEEVTLHG